MRGFLAILAIASLTIGTVMILGIISDIRAKERRDIERDFRQDLENDNRVMNPHEMRWRQDMIDRDRERRGY